MSTEKRTPTQVDYDRIVNSLRCIAVNLALAERENDIGPYGRLAKTAADATLERLGQKVITGARNRGTRAFVDSLVIRDKLVGACKTALDVICALQSKLGIAVIDASGLSHLGYCGAIAEIRAALALAEPAAVARADHAAVCREMEKRE